MVKKCNGNTVFALTGHMLYPQPKIKDVPDPGFYQLPSDFGYYQVGDRNPSLGKALTARPHTQEGWAPAGTYLNLTASQRQKVVPTRKQKSRNRPQFRV